MRQTTAIRQIARHPEAITPELLDILKKMPNPPPQDLRLSDIFVRRCRLAGDRVDSHRGRFRTEFLPQLLKMANGAPLLIGHQKDQAPIGRFFGGQVESEANGEGNCSYIVPFFYWPQGLRGSNDLRLLIDSGIYSEASISFVYKKPSCSKCGKDIRGCKHLNLLYGGDPDLHFYYDDVQQVLEGSIVYRGSEPGTGFILCFSENDKIQ
jgi:hypothetical protein